MQAIPSERIDWKFMLPLVLGTMMNPLNTTMLATALREICGSFSEGPEAGALLITPLYIAVCIGQPLMGKLADLYDPKAINRLGFFIVLLGALIAAFAPAFYWLIISRVLFGLGTAASYPSAMALVAAKYGNNSRAIPGNVLAIITLSSQVSMVLGPLLGGLLTEAFGWQGVFLINIPWALAALFLSRFIPAVPRLRPETKIPFWKKTDLVGMMLFTSCLVLLLITLTQEVNAWIFGSATLVSFVFFLLWETRHLYPFIDIRLLRHQPSLLLVYLRTVSTNYVLYLLLYSLPEWIEAVKKMTPGETGWIMLSMSLMSAIFTVLMSKVKRQDVLNVAGVLSLLAASACLFLLNHAVSPVWIVGATSLAGISIGINIMANQSSLSAESRADQAGISFGLFRTFSALGAIFSGIQRKSLFLGGVSDSSLHTCGWYAAVSCAILILLYCIRPSKTQEIGKAA